VPVSLQTVYITAIRPIWRRMVAKDQFEQGGESAARTEFRTFPFVPEREGSAQSDPSPNQQTKPHGAQS
jgi:hypothetical protein